MSSAVPPPRPFLRRSKASAPVLKAGARVREHRLENGMRVLLGERRGDPAVASLIFYGVGSKNESEREAGMSHFLEHMMFKGSRRFGKGEVDRLTTELGGQNNAFTGHDHTAYWFEFASDRWETALDIEADRMTRLAIDPVEFDAERAVVLEELAMGEDEPWRVLARRVEAALLPRHPYGRPIIGYEDTLSAMTPDDMRDYYRRFYHPGNAVLVVCGDVSPSKALRAVRERFASIPAGPPLAEADCFRPRVAPPYGEQRVNMAWDDESRRLIMAWPTEPVATECDFALDVALTVLTSGRLSRMQKRLVREEGLATSISASNDTRVEAGFFWLYAECAQGVEPEALERAIDEELARLAEEKIDAGEMRRVQAIVRASDAFDGEGISDLAENLGEFAVDCDWDMAFDGGVRHRKITPEKLRRHVAAYLTPGRRVVGWCRPRADERSGGGSGRARRAAGQGRGR